MSIPRDDDEYCIATGPEHTDPPELPFHGLCRSNGELDASFFWKLTHPHLLRNWGGPR